MNCELFLTYLDRCGTTFWRAQMRNAGRVGREKPRRYKSDVYCIESLIVSLARTLCTFSSLQDPLVGGAYFSALTVPDKPLDQVLPQLELFTYSVM